MAFNPTYVCVFLVFFLNIAFSQVQYEDTIFNKQKWLNSAEYRYKIVRGKAFPKIETLNRKQIIKLLGEPLSKEGESLTYCLDIISKENGKIDCYAILLISKNKNTDASYQMTIMQYDPEKQKKCIGVPKENAELTDW